MLKFTPSGTFGGSSGQSATGGRRTKRPDLSDFRLLIGLALAVLVGALALASLSWLPEPLARSGSPLLQSAAIVGAALLLLALAYTPLKRSGFWGTRAHAPIRWFALHVASAIVGTVLVVVHSKGTLDRWPSLLLLILFLLVVLGGLGRARMAREMASTFARKRAGFRTPDPQVREALRAVLERKRSLLERLAPDQDEAEFSLRPSDWRRNPTLAWLFWREVHRERALMRTRQSVGFLQAWWRTAHLLLAAAFLVALLGHVIVVTFFAGYAADYGEPYWWYLTAW